MIEYYGVKVVKHCKTQWVINNNDLWQKKYGDNMEVLLGA